MFLRQQVAATAIDSSVPGDPRRYSSSAFVAFLRSAAVPLAHPRTIHNP